MAAVRDCVHLADVDTMSSSLLSGTASLYLTIVAAVLQWHLKASVKALDTRCWVHFQHHLVPICEPVEFSVCFDGSGDPLASKNNSINFGRRGGVTPITLSRLWQLFEQGLLFAQSCEVFSAPARKERRSDSNVLLLVCGGWSDEAHRE